MRKLKSKNVYKASNFEFNADDIAAWSYGWWQFVKVIDGKVVFNNYRYSVSTGKHQSKARCLMQDLKISIDCFVSTKESISNWDSRKLSEHLNTTQLKRSNANSVKNFLSKNNLKKLTKFLNSGLSRWDDQSRLYVEFEGFEQMDKIDRDTNGDSLNVQYIKRVVEASGGLELEREYSGSLGLYLIDRSRNLSFTAKNSKNERKVFNLIGTHGKEQQWCYNRSEIADRLSLFSNVQSYKRKQRCKILLDKALYLISDQSSLNRALETEDSLLSRILKRLGLSIVKSFDFGKRVSVKVDFVEVSLDGHRITLGSWSNNTYNSLPQLVTITKRKSEPQRTKLSDIGLEKRGYYDHHNHAVILNENLEDAKRFGARFKRMESAKLRGVK